MNVSSWQGIHLLSASFKELKEIQAELWSLQSQREAEWHNREITRG
jgi:hypothetical protein